MAEGGCEQSPVEPDDEGDGSDSDGDTTNPFTPGVHSTPYDGGEQHEMSHI